MLDKFEPVAQKLGEAIDQAENHAGVLIISKDLGEDLSCIGFVIGDHSLVVNSILVIFSQYPDILKDVLLSLSTDVAGHA